MSKISSEPNHKRNLSLKVVGNEIFFKDHVKKDRMVEDDSFSSGGAGFVVDKGTIVADGFLVSGK